MLSLKYGLPEYDEDIERTGRTEWYTKLYICHKRFKSQDNVTSLDPKRARILFKARLGMFDINIISRGSTILEQIC